MIQTNVNDEWLHHRGKGKGKTKKHKSENRENKISLQVGGRRWSDNPQKVSHKSRMAERAKKARVLQGKGRSG